MFRSYLTIALRNLSRNKVYSFINICGLALGMTVAGLIGLWVHDELSFNKYHKNYDRIGQVMKSGVQDDGTPFGGGFSQPFPMIDLLRANYSSNFSYIVEALPPGESILTVGENKISAIGQSMAAGAPHMLTLDMIAGSRDGLKEPGSILLAESMARNLFQDGDALGKTVRANTSDDLLVTGVFRDLPHNTKFNELKFMTSFENTLLRQTWIREQNWQNQFLHIYCEIAPGKTFDDVNNSIALAQQKAIAHLEGLAEWQIRERPQISLVPMKDWHLRSSFSWPNYGKADRGPVRFVWLIGTIGGFVLILACINFMNLSTAQSQRRAREVGIRKSMGSFRRQLIGQFFAESYLVVVVAFMFSLLLIVLTLPYFNSISAKNLSIPWSNALYWLAVGCFIFLTGLVAGSYPALYLSSFNPIKTLKGTFKTGKLASVPRKILVVLQFTVSVTLIIGTIIVYNQIVYAKNRPVGYAREGLLLVKKKSDEFFGKTDILRNELKKTGMVEEISESVGKVTTVWSNNNGFSWEGKEIMSKEGFGTLGVTPEYGSTLQWKFIEGRDFSPGASSDANSIVINESARKVIGEANVVGHSLHWKNTFNGVDDDFLIIGVIRDMVMDSPYQPARPTIFLLRSQWLGWFNIRLQPGSNTAEALASTGSVFRKIIPSAPFEFEFADTAYAAKFATEERIASLAMIFAILAIAISCLGLFGLASFVAEQRAKEMAIRKVVGATVFRLWQMQSADFVALVVISSIISAGISYFAATSWLKQYPYRTDLSPWAFILSIMGAILLTLATVSYQALRAANTNPVVSLKSE